MIGKIEHCSYMTMEQRQLVLALLVSLPVGCTRTTEQVLPSGHFAFTIEGPLPVIAELRKQLVEIIGFETPGLREYTLQEAYNTFGYRTYTDVVYKAEERLYLNDREGMHTHFLLPKTKVIIYGMSISSGQIFAQIQGDMESTSCAYVTLHELARDFEWPDGSPCGVVMPSKSIQKRHAAQRGGS